MSSHKFEEKLSALGIVLDDRQKEQFDLFYEILVEWNEFMNLTGITEYEEVNGKTFCRFCFYRKSDGHEVV